MTSIYFFLKNILLSVVIVVVSFKFNFMKLQRIETTEGEYSVRDIFSEIRETALRERLSSFAQYRDLIDEIVEEKRIYGLFSDDEDTTQIKKDLEQMWPETKDVLEKSAGKPLP